MSVKHSERRRIMVRGLTVFSALGAGEQPRGLREIWRATMSESEPSRQKWREGCRLEVKAYVNAVAWNADGSRLAALSNSGVTVTVWETAKWTITNEFNRYGGAYSHNSLAFLPDGSLLTSAPIGVSPDPRYETLAIFFLIQWDIDTGQPIRYICDLAILQKALQQRLAPQKRSLSSLMV